MDVSTSGYVGNTASGSLILNSGSSLLANSCYIGYGAGVDGTAAVQGSGSTWNAKLTLSIGESGNGTLNISDGAIVNGPLGYIGRNSGSTGTVTVTGTGSAWNKTGGSLYVGYDGSGTLNIVGQGAVNNASATIGRSALATGIVNVPGLGSLWANSQNLSVGCNGSER